MLTKLADLPRPVAPAEPIVVPTTAAPSDPTRVPRARRRTVLGGMFALAGGAAVNALSLLPTARPAAAYNTCTRSVTIRSINASNQCGYNYSSDNDAQFSGSCVRCSPSTVSSSYCASDDYHKLSSNCDTSTYPNNTYGHRANECVGSDGWHWTNPGCCPGDSSKSHVHRCHDGFLVFTLYGSKIVAPTICPKSWCA